MSVGRRSNWTKDDRKESGHKLRCLSLTVTLRSSGHFLALSRSWKSRTGKCTLNWPCKSFRITRARAIRVRYPFDVEKLGSSNWAPKRGRLRLNDRVNAKRPLPVRYFLARVELTGERSSYKGGRIRIRPRACAHDAWNCARHFEKLPRSYLSHA